MSNSYYIVSMLILFLLGFTGFVYLNRFTSEAQMNSCLIAREQFAENNPQINYVKNLSDIPHCDLFGKWRRKQNDANGNSWCVTPDGIRIAGTETPPGFEAAQCKTSLAERAMTRFTDTYL